MIVDYIDGHRDEFGVEPICSVLEIAPSTYYAAKDREPSARAVRDVVLKVTLLAFWKAAQRAGLEAGRDQVARHPELVERRFVASRPNEL